MLLEADEELRAALDELRALARGIHPAVLTDQGLAAALGSLAHRSTVPVEVRQVPDRRLPAAVEAAAYFVTSEALANVAKYAQASQCPSTRRSTVSGCAWRSPTTGSAGPTRPPAAA
jgi:signal transduction histidine kinase